MTKPKLKPCPWCGDEAAYQYTGLCVNFQVGCFNRKCPIQPELTESTRSLAIRRWNKRKAGKK